MRASAKAPPIVVTRVILRDAAVNSGAVVDNRALIEELDLDNLPFTEGKWSERDRAALLAADPETLDIIRTSRNFLSFATQLEAMHPGMTIERASLDYGFVARYFNARTHRRLLARALGGR